MVDINNTPYMQAVERNFPTVITSMLQRGMITQQEYNIVTSNYPQLKQVYVQALLRYPQLTEQQIISDLQNNFIAKQISRLRSGGYMQQPMMMQNPMMQSSMFTGGGMGMYGAQMPMGGGGSIFNGGGYNQTLLGTGNDYASMLNQTPQPVGQPQPAFQPQQPAMKQEPVVQKQAPVGSKDWAPPEWESDDLKKVFSQNGTLNVSAKYARRSNGKRHLHLIAVESSLKYQNPDEIVKSIRTIPGIFRNVDSYTISVGYLEPVLLEVGMKEVQDLADEFTRELGTSTGILGKGKGIGNIGALVKILDKHSSGLNREFLKFLIEEFNSHMNCGELCDEKHAIPMADINNIRIIEDMAARSNIFDAATLKDFNEITSFDEYLNVIVAKAITQYIENLKKYIIDPKVSLEYLETYFKMCPRYITKDDVNYAAVPDIIKLFMTSKEHVNGSPSKRAQQAKTDYEVAIGELVSRHTVMFHPKVVTFSSLDPGQAIFYDDAGRVNPRYYKKAVNDLSYFLFETMHVFMQMDNKFFQSATHSLLFENDEITTKVFFGIGTDQGIWTGNCRFW